MHKLVLSALFVSLLAGCAGKDVKPTTPPVEERPQPTKPPERPPGVEVKPAKEAPVAGEALKDPRLKDPRHPLGKRVIYFDFDSDQIKEEFKQVIQAHAKFMQENPALRLKLEGHADERGSREYNLALGQRRADSVKRALAVSGVAETRIETASFGEEKPAAQGHNEDAWAQNRRSVIVYQGE
jgi:peptidoglycan-associated lipoprotein